MFKVVINLAIFFLVIIFAWYMVVKITNDNSQIIDADEILYEPFDSPYQRITSFELPEEINRFELKDEHLFISAGQFVYIFDMEGNKLDGFQVEPDARDITISNTKEIYLLYPAKIIVYSIDGKEIRHWEACSRLSDYCSFTIVGDVLFVTDAENKNICKYTTNGDFIKFIRSPQGFIIPSYSFDIDSWNDTIYCSNSGRHSIEIYSFDGDFISSFGASIADGGYFAGCCNPAYLSFTPDGELITSEKGIPRVSSFSRNGVLNAALLNGKMLESGNKACEIKADVNKLFVASKNKILIFERITG